MRNDRQRGANASMVSGRALRFLGVGALSVTLVAPLAAPALIPDREPIASRVIVRFLDGVSAEEQSQVLASHGADVVTRIPELELVVVDVAIDPTRAILSFFSEPLVASADLDRTREATGSIGDRADDARWALRRVAAPSVDPLRSSTLAVLDTGVDVGDAALTGQVLQGWSAIGGDPLEDPNGHGTAIAAIAAGSSSDAERASGVASRGVVILPIRVLDAEGVGRDSDIIRGIVHAVDRGADVILLGFSGPGYSRALQVALDYAWSRGAVLVAPVGDSSSTEPLFPAGNARVMGVGATTGIDTRWVSSNRGASVFVAAPGLEVPVDAERSFTGTAAAAAIVAGGAGLLAAADRTASNAAIVGRLARGADAVGPRAEVGNGRIDVTAALADRSEVGLVPNGVLGGEGGPFVTTFRSSRAPLAGWALDHATFLGETVFPIVVEGSATPVLSSTSMTAAPAMTLWHRSLTADPLTDGAILRQRSFLVGALLDDPFASDHGTFTYGSVSPPAVAYGVLS